MTTKITNLRELPNISNYNTNDVLVLFGEVFNKGYANGLIQAAKSKNMRIIALVMGRRDEDNKLRELNEQEESELRQATGGEVINFPLWAGFDTDSYEGLPTLTQLCAHVSVKNWKEATLDWDKVNRIREKGRESFNIRVEHVMNLLKEKISDDSNIVFAHLMAGGLPRVRMNMVISNRVVRGSGKRFESSAEFWKTDLGKLAQMGFSEVSAETFRVLLNKSQVIRERNESKGNSVSYIAYGYHGTEILIDDTLQWQSYVPYLPGKAKIELENIAIQAMKNNIKASVFNCPEVETNSSAIFSGVEMPLYPLIFSLQKAVTSQTRGEIVEKLKFWKENPVVQDILQGANQYHTSKCMQDLYSQFDSFPMDNTLDQMNDMLSAAEAISHKVQDSEVADLRLYLSSLVVEATGKLMLDQSANLKEPVYWLGHDIIAKSIVEK